MARRARVFADKLGLLTVVPNCSGNCTIELHYDGGLEMRLAHWISRAAMAGCLLWILLTAIARKQADPKRRWSVIPRRSRNQREEPFASGIIGEDGECEMGLVLLTERYADQIGGVIHCFDRLIFQGVLPQINYAKGMTDYFYAHELLIKDFTRTAPLAV